MAYAEQKDQQCSAKLLGLEHFISPASAQAMSPACLPHYKETRIKSILHNLAVIIFNHKIKAHGVHILDLNNSNNLSILIRAFHGRNRSDDHPGKPFAKLSFESCLPLCHWEALYYALVINIRRIHKAITARLASDPNSATSVLHDHGWDGSKTGKPFTMLELALRLEEMWLMLTDPRLLAPLEHAVRVESVIRNTLLLLPDELSRHHFKQKWSRVNADQVTMAVELAEGMMDTSRLSDDELDQQLWKKFMPRIESACYEQFHIQLSIADAHGAKEHHSVTPKATACQGSGSSTKLSHNASTDKANMGINTAVDNSPLVLTPLRQIAQQPLAIRTKPSVKDIVGKLDQAVKQREVKKQDHNTLRDDSPTASKRSVKDPIPLSLYLDPLDGRKSYTAHLNIAPQHSLAHASSQPSIVIPQRKPVPSCYLSSVDESAVRAFRQTSPNPACFVKAACHRDIKSVPDFRLEANCPTIFQAKQFHKSSNHSAAGSETGQISVVKPGIRHFPVQRQNDSLVSAINNTETVVNNLAKHSASEYDPGNPFVNCADTACQGSSKAALVNLEQPQTHGQMSATVTPSSKRPRRVPVPLTIDTSSKFAQRRAIPKPPSSHLPTSHSGQSTCTSGCHSSSIPTIPSSIPTSVQSSFAPGIGHSDTPASSLDSARPPSRPWMNSNSQPSSSCTTLSSPDEPTSPTVLLAGSLSMPSRIPPVPPTPTRTSTEMRSLSLPSFIAPPRATRQRYVEAGGSAKLADRMTIPEAALPAALRAGAVVGVGEDHSTAGHAGDDCYSALVLRTAVEEQRDEVMIIPASGGKRSRGVRGKLKRIFSANGGGGSGNETSGDD